MYQQTGQLGSGNPPVAVYALREKFTELNEKREQLKRDEDSILRDAIEKLPLGQKMIHSGVSLYDQALDSLVEGTQGSDNLNAWRHEYLKNREA
jgi:hypothetical protein